MEHISGILGLLCVAIITVVLALRYPRLRWVLVVAFGVRAGAALFHCYFAPLPDGTADALRFEREAWEYTQLGFLELAVSFPGRNQNIYPWTVAWLYALTDRSLLLAQSLSVLAGVGSVFLTWKLAWELRGDRAGIKAAWVAALFPTLILYSVLTLREVFVVFFFLFGLIGVVRWLRKSGVWPLLLVLFSFMVAASLHGGMFGAIFVFLAFAVWRSGRQVFASLGRLRFKVGTSVLLMMVIAGGIWYISDRFNIPYLGTFSSLRDTDNLIRYTIHTEILDPGSKYPGWVLPVTGTELLWKGPLRVIYFLFSPFPWDIRNLHHLIGLIDGLLYLFLVVLIWRNRQAIWSDPAARTILLIILALALIHSLGSGNFGTGLRHRSKFVCGMVVLAAPLLPRIRWRDGRVGQKAVVCGAGK